MIKDKMCPFALRTEREDHTGPYLVGGLCALDQCAAYVPAAGSRMSVRNATPRIAARAIEQVPGSSEEDGHLLVRRIGDGTCSRLTT